MFLPLRRLFLLVPAAILLAGCAEQAPQFRTTDITGVDYGQTFELTDHNGQRRTLEDFRGKAVTLFFGFTQCPDVCPTSLSTMSEVMRKLGSDADRVQVLFITVDPERDTQELLAEYVPVFDERFLGLYGDAEETAAVADEFRIYYAKSGDTEGKHYNVDHSAGTYILDPEGRLRLYARYGEPAEAIAEDLEVLLAEE